MKYTTATSLYVSVMLAISVAAWADGCLTAYPSQRVPGGPGGAILTAAPNCFSDTYCSQQFYVHSAIECSNDLCVPGRCAEPGTGLWCTGSQSPWTQNRWQTQSWTFNCYYVGIGGECWNVPWHPVTDWACMPNGSQTAYCYTAWYNDPAGRCSE